jgi:PAS domain S-box-containing protein
VKLAGNPPLTAPIRKQPVFADAGPSEARELSHWQAAAKRFTFAARLDEAAITLHPVIPAKVTMALLAAALASLILPWAICGLWVAGALGLEMWGWFASRPHAGADAVRRRGLFAASYLAINGWWVVLATLLWSSGLPSGQALGASMVSALAAVSMLLFYNAPVGFLVAGAAPAIAALSVIALNDGRDLRQMLPVWLGLGLCAVFCGGRALKTPSAQESERRVNASLRDFQIIAENVTDVITRTNLDGIREYVSPGCFAMLGFRPDELVGTRQSDFHHPDDKAAIDASLARLKADPTRHDSMTVRVRHKDGRWLWLQASGRVAIEDGVPVGLIGVSRDVTEQVAAQAALVAATAEAESANRAKAEFLANVSHEIRTPMNGILSALHLLEREQISEEGRELMRHATGSGRMLSQLLNDVLDFSKIEAGQLDLAPEPMNVGETLEAVIALLSGQARAKGVDLRFETVGEDMWIEADPVRVRQAMFNLVGNAVKFTAHGHITARLAVDALCAKAARADLRRVRLEVEDTGIGISLEAQAHLFERFRQADGETSRRFGGTGLGLSITEALARMMGGEISVHSVEGEGSTFRMAFEAPAAQPVSVAPVEEGLLDGVSILLVEDNVTNRLVARTMLTRLGANVEEAEDGVVGLEAARRGGHDLILMDIQMPHMDGLEATRAIRGLSTPAAQVPIIGLTANVMVHQRAEYMAAGMNGVVGKPISPALLLSEIARVISEGDEAEPRAGTETG